ncbi:bifunctional dethiobiotin synthetase/7,8-diamino-pelargonic acid aminotransferase, mitochondrial isoform X2 [Malania oleifera]|uniref:bifunctional dethiobiotin synthetase/7,8-diamino-pelargonic acid aminotransferase, mitochondrial isoform X2 n=1 Tax=Malania oleifera TaxID=397392 RepID=UPI0025AE0F8F|nr:bifunctional dethiobiotin synthetase/7,8-diamino-pelargonic acid aminotransferase, mitochondrial isoform X2 [Malania oleifera]
MFLPASALLTHRRRRIIPSATLFLRLGLRRQSLCTAVSPPLEYTLSHPIYSVWGANTGLGKTLVSTGLAASALLSPSSSPTKFIYLKPVQTGFPADSDSRFVFRKVSELFRRRKPLISIFASNHVLKASDAAAEAVLGRVESELGGAGDSGMRDLGWYEESKLHGWEDSGEVAASELICKTMYGWREAISPHLAVEREGAVVGDSLVIEMLRKCLGIGLENESKSSRVDIWSVVETAGGVASPGPSGSLQCDLYRPFRLPAILVGDGQLGGISGTISAYESLNLRGYDVAAIVFEDHGLANEVPLLSYLRNKWFQIELAKNMGYAAARFGHVMFPENVYEPALECAELLLEGVGKGWASRVFFSDNGSTAIEIALKMAFRKFCFDHEILCDTSKANVVEKCIELRVLALKGCYHGDTLGAMEAQAPSSYTGFLQQPWYTGRGLFLDPPTVFMYNGMWNLSLPEGMQDEKLKPEVITFTSRDELFCKSRDDSDLAGCYSSYISQQLLLHSGSEGFTHIGALIIEPVMLAAGGMHMVDPLFQRVLVNMCQRKKIPVIFDEVFTGFWRLGMESAAELLCCHPDVACFAKLMTGGMIPLAATLATNAVFDAFYGESKLKALLHGHSYSAHAMGCAAAAKSIKWFKDPQTNGNLTSEGRFLRELWDMELVHQISSHPAVQRLVVLGTLCALELRAEGCNAGYGSLYATALLRKLQEDGVYMRPLGNVIYLMCGPCTSPHICTQLLLKLYCGLEEFSQSKQPM